MNHVFLTNKANKALRKIDVSDKVKLLETLELLKTFPNFPRNIDIKKLQAEIYTYRIRVGVHRVIFNYSNTKLVVIVTDITHRKDAYK